jgi:positive regulator of sigma E activity
MALALPVLRNRRDGKAQFVLPFPYVFSGLALLFSVVLLTRMGRSEFYVIGATCAIALLNWAFVRRWKQKQESTVTQLD